MFGIQALAARGEEGVLRDRRGYTLDLAPKLLYAAEPLVDLLVRCRCHHYLEFKAAEGSYLLQEGALRAVPAGRADIFRDRRLGLADKRALMRFIQGCAEARSGQGHLQAALSSDRPLAEVLAAEGLPPRLREVILYGIAMCDTDQEAPQPQQPAPPAGAEALADTEAAGVARSAEAQADGTTSASAAAPSATERMSGAEGGAALELFSSSQGRFGQDGAFMLPSYGCGSVSEAFVRLGAVHGAVTVLRQPVQALLLAAAAAAAEEEGAQGVQAAGVTGMPELGSAEPTLAEAEAAAAADALPDGPAARAGTAAEAVEEGARQTSQGQCEGSGTIGDASGGGGSPRCMGIVTVAGQVVRCGTVVAGAGTLSCLEGVSALPQQESVSRAVVILDGPLISRDAQQQQQSTQQTASSRPQAPPSLLTLVLPPRATGASGTASGGGGGNPHPVRGLQFSASTCVCPAGRVLLYLSTPATAASAHEDLWSALDTLVDTSLLREPAPSTAPPATLADGEASASSATAGEAVAASTAGADAEAETAAVSTASAAPAAGADGSAPRPRALRAWFYRQPVLHRAAGALQAQLPGGVVAVPGPDGSLAGYGAVLRATEAVFRSAFPGVPWLSEADFSEKGRGGGGEGEEEGASGGAAAYDPGEEDAIDELTAAVARLKDA